VLFSVTYFQLKTSDRLFSNKIVRLVQPNAVQEKKWDPLYSPIYFEVLLDLTSSGEKATVDLIIWPESAIVPFLDDATAEFKKIGENMPSDSELILGIRRQNKNNIYNSLVLLNNDGLVSGSYDKFHLVPFGEYIPILRYLEKLGLIFTENFSNIGFSPGNAVAVLSSKIGLFRPLICYEAIFFQEIYHESRPDFIVNITNDAWLGDWAGPSQHLQQVKMRAIEQGLPVIRSANTGISAIVNPYGETIASIGLGLRGYVDVLLPLKVKKTFYSLTGERVNFFIIFIWFFMIFFRRKKIVIDDTYH
jgi:apolipoprotein N-acyltransferase